MKDLQKWSNNKEIKSKWDPSFQFREPRENSSLDFLWMEFVSQIDSNIVDRESLQTRLDELTWRFSNEHSGRGIYQSLLDTIAKHHPLNNSAQKYSSDDGFQTNETNNFISEPSRVDSSDRRFENTNEIDSEINNEIASLVGSRKVTIEKIYESNDLLKVVPYLKQKKIIMEEVPFCDACNSPRKLKLRCLNYCWICVNNQCRKQLNVKAYSFFESYSTSLVNLNKLMFYWSKGLDVDEISRIIGTLYVV